MDKMSLNSWFQPLYCHNSTTVTHFCLV